MGYLNTSEGRIFYSHYRGQRRPVVLIHGWAVTQHCWDSVIHDLLDRGHEVVAMDMRAAGRSDADFTDVSIEAIGQDVVDLIDHLGLSKPALNGWSTGGAVAIDAAAKLADNIGGVVLTGGATPRYSSTSDWPYGLAREDVLGILDGARLNRHGTMMMVATAVGHQDRSDETRDWLWGQFLESSPNSNGTLRSLADIDQRAIFESLDVPVHLLHGVHDTFASIDGARAALSLLKHGTMFEFENSGHAPFIDETELYLEELARFLQGLDE